MNFQRLTALALLLALFCPHPLQAGMSIEFEPLEENLRTPEPPVATVPVLLPASPPTAEKVLDQRLVEAPPEPLGTGAADSGGGSNWIWWTIGTLVVVGGIAAAAGGGGGGGGGGSTPAPAGSDTGTVSGSW